MLRYVLLLAQKIAESAITHMGSKDRCVRLCTLETMDIREHRHRLTVRAATCGKTGADSKFDLSRIVPMLALSLRGMVLGYPACASAGTG